MKEKITPELLMHSIKAKKKKTAIGVVIGFAGMSAITTYVIHPFGLFTVLNVLLTILAITAIVLVIVLSKGHSIIRAIKADEIDVYEDQIQAIYTGIRLPIMGKVLEFFQKPLGICIIICVPVGIYFAYEIIKRSKSSKASEQKIAELEARLAQQSQEKKEEEQNNAE